MITSIRFENFRGFQNLSLQGLERITLISGKNNAGKSSILEGIFLAMDHAAPDSFLKVNGFRGLPLVYDANCLWEPLFFELNTKEKMRISMQLKEEAAALEYEREDSFIPSDGAGAPQDVFNQFLQSAKANYSLKFNFKYGEYSESGHYVVSSSGVLRNISTSIDGNQIKPLMLTHYINSATINNAIVLAEWFSNLQLRGKKQQVIDILKVMDPTISDISAIVIKGQIQLYAKMGEKLLPLKLAGDGINKLLFLILTIVENPNSLVLIDEIETGFHYSMYPKLWKILAIAARENNCQIIATTHSYECIDGVTEGIGLEEAEDFCYFRIERNAGESKAFRYSGNLLRTAIHSNMEVR